MWHDILLFVAGIYIGGAGILFYLVTSSPPPEADGKSPTIFQALIFALIWPLMILKSCFSNNKQI